MKMSAHHFTILKSAMRTMIQSLELGRDQRLQILDECKNPDTANASAMRLYWAAVFQLQYDDDHPSFTSGRTKRVVAYCPAWWGETKNLNGDHIQTAYRKAFRELLVELAKPPESAKSESDVIPFEEAINVQLQELLNDRSLDGLIDSLGD